MLATRTPESGAIMKNSLPTKLAVPALAFACGPTQAQAPTGNAELAAAQAAFGELVWWRI